MSADFDQPALSPTSHGARPRGQESQEPLDPQVGDVAGWLGVFLMAATPFLLFALFAVLDRVLR